MTINNLQARVYKFILFCMAFGMAVPCVYAKYSLGAHQISGVTQINYVNADAQTSFLSAGAGGLRYDNQDSNVHLGLFAINYQGELSQSVSIKASGIYYDDLDHDFDLTQVSLNYSPLPIKRYRLRARLGYFYPAFSLENTQAGWLSKSGLSNSAINSWIAEEIRPAGLEVSFTRPGRQFRSKVSWTLEGAVFKGGDPAGTQLGWRGWSVHDRQTGLNEAIPLAPFGALNSATPLASQDRNIRISEEIDGRFGHYFGLKGRYLSKLEVRLHRYDNNADPTALRRNAQTGAINWAWDTRFNHGAVRYVINRNWQLYGQYITGSSEAGNRLIVMDFDAKYVTLRYQNKKHLVNVRFDDFTTTDLDALFAIRNNDGDGDAISIQYRYRYSKWMNFAAEYLSLKKTRPNLVSLIGDADLDQDQFTLAMNINW